jgi:uncharacterized protein (DUF58 family)
MIPDSRLVFLIAATAPLWLLALVSPALLPIPVAAIGALAAAAGVSWLLAPGRRSVAIQRFIPPRFSLGDEQEVTMTLTLSGRRGADVEVRDHVPPNLLVTAQAPRVSVTPGAAAAVSYRVRSLQRGAAPFPAVTVRTRGGLGLVRRQFTVAHRSDAKVYPSFLRAHRYDLLAVADRREEATRIPRTARGHGSDFESLRPYTPGDDLRRIDWKTTAKRGFLVSRTFRVDRGQQLTVLLDAGRFMAERLGERTRFEHAVNAAVMLSSTAQTRGDSVSVACFSNRMESFLPAIRGRETVARVLETLADVQARPVESDYWHVFSQVLARLRKRCLIVLFCEVLDRASSAALLHSLARSAAKHLILVVVLVDELVGAAAEAPAEAPAAAAARPVGGAAAHEPAAVPPGFYRTAAASHVLLERILALNEMRSRGILVLETTPERLSLDVINRYLGIRKTSVL